MFNETIKEKRKDFILLYKVFKKNGTPYDLQKYTFWENDPNKSCRGHEELSFGLDFDFELDLEVDLDTDSAS